MTGAIDCGDSPRKTAIFLALAHMCAEYPEGQEIARLQSLIDEDPPEKDLPRLEESGYRIEEVRACAREMIDALKAGAQ